MIFPLASEGGCQLMMMVRGLFSLLTTVTSLGEELGTETGRPFRTGWTCLTFQSRSERAVTNEEVEIAC